MSIAIGYPSIEVNATTSGQLTDLKMNTSKEDIFLSWIGGALGITVSGGVSILLLIRIFYLIYLKDGNFIAKL